MSNDQQFITIAQYEELSNKYMELEKKLKEEREEYKSYYKYVRESSNVINMIKNEELMNNEGFVNKEYFYEKSYIESLKNKINHLIRHNDDLKDKIIRLNEHMENMHVK